MLDFKRVEKESNMMFYKINRELLIYKYMVGSSDTSIKTFIPPLFNQEEFEKVLSLKKNEMSNKLLFFKAAKHNYEQQVNTLTSSLFGRKPMGIPETSKKDIVDRTFGLMKERRCHSVTDNREINHETINEKIYRKTVHWANNIASLKEGFKKENSFSVINVLEKELSMKQFADVIESLAAATYLKTGLHGSQVFLKSIGVLENTSGYQRKYWRLIEDIESQDYIEYQKTKAIRDIEKKVLGYTFKYKKLLVVALTHSSYNNTKAWNKNFYSSYENLEYLGDAVHKFLVVKRLKENLESQLDGTEMNVGKLLFVKFRKYIRDHRYSQQKENSSRDESVARIHMYSQGDLERNSRKVQRLMFSTQHPIQTTFQSMRR